MRTLLFFSYFFTYVFSLKPIDRGSGRARDEVNIIPAKRVRFDEQAQKLLDRKLFTSIQNGDVKDIKDSLQLGANVEAVNASGMTPFLWAIWNGGAPQSSRQMIEIMQCLVESGANINFITKKGWNAWYTLAACGHCRFDHVDPTSHNVLRDAGVNILPAFFPILDMDTRQTNLLDYIIYSNDACIADTRKLMRVAKYVKLLFVLMGAGLPRETIEMIAKQITLFGGIMQQKRFNPKSDEVRAIDDSSHSSSRGDAIKQASASIDRFDQFYEKFHHPKKVKKVKMKKPYFTIETENGVQGFDIEIQSILLDAKAKGLDAIEYYWKERPYRVDFIDMTWTRMRDSASRNINFVEQEKTA